MDTIFKIFTAFLLLIQSSSGFASTTPVALSASPVLHIGATTLFLEIADTEAKQTQGLSDRVSLPEDHAMLFVFPAPSDVGFWMKDMNFGLDMIWLDQDYRVITVKSDITPDSYPEVLYPDAPATYVLETNAGFAKQHDIVPGTVLDITNLPVKKY